MNRLEAFFGKFSMQAIAAGYVVKMAARTNKILSIEIQTPPVKGTVPKRRQAEIAHASIMNQDNDVYDMAEMLFRDMEYYIKR